MADSTILEPKALAQIAQQVADYLPVGLQRDAGALQLGETFEVWRLRLPLSDGDDLEAAARSDNEFHHQLYVRAQPVGFVRSRRPAPGQGTWEVTEVFESPLAKSVDAAMRRVDQLMPQPAITRLLLAPIYQLSALWMVDSVNNVHIVACPLILDHVDRTKLIPGAELLHALRSEKPIGGLIRGREQARSS
jgi:hypothetical protein